MKTKFVPYELSLRLKDLGFDEECLMMYYGISREDKATELYLPSGFGSVKNSDYVEKDHGITAPLWIDAIEWVTVKLGYSHNIINEWFIKNNYLTDDRNQLRQMCLNNLIYTLELKVNKETAPLIKCVDFYQLVKDNSEDFLNEAVKQFGIIFPDRKELKVDDESFKLDDDEGICFVIIDDAEIQHQIFFDDHEGDQPFEDYFVFMGNKIGYWSYYDEMD